MTVSYTHLDVYKRQLPVDKGGRIADDGHFIPVPVVIGFDVECGCHYHICIMFLPRPIDCIAADDDQVAIHLLFGLFSGERPFVFDASFRFVYGPFSIRN